VARYQDVVLSADRGELNKNTGEMVLEGAVSLQRANQLWRGDRLRYNFLTRQMATDAFRTGGPPLFASGQGLTADPTNNLYTARGAMVTTDDVAQPGLRVQAKSLTIAPGKYLEARRAVVYAGRIPIFYLPYVRYNLDRESNYLSLTPGYRSSFGPYLLGAYHWKANQDVSGDVRLDYRFKRGLAGGPDVLYDVGRWGQGDVRFYYLYDTEPAATSATNNTSVPHNRERLYFTHELTLRTNLDARLVLRQQSDAYITRDFLEPEYRQNPQPSSFLDLSQRWPNFSLSLFAQPQINDFQETIERLPDVRLTALRQQVGASPLFYESESSLGYYRHSFAEETPTNDYGAFRADTLHQVTLPLALFGWLNLTPRAGGRFTHYGETGGDGSVLTEQDRWVFNTGAELSFKVSRLWPTTRNRLFEIDGLRHVVQPSFNYAYVPEPSVRPPQLPQFDTELPSLRLLPIEFPDYNAIDAVDTWNVLRLGLRQRLQTKRQGELDSVVNWALYTDWRLQRQPGQSTFSDLFSDLDLKPRSWLTLTSQIRYDVGDNRLSQAHHVLTLTPNPTWSWGVGHYYVRDDPALGYPEGDNLLTSAFYYRLNENWGVRFSHHYSLRDHVMEEQYYTLYRDFRSWTGALTFRVRDNRDEGTDYGVAFTFSIKAFPRFRLGDDINKPSLLLGG
jgi:lipopolysaccharide assembly outer membrane protein LptD (OstA)